MTLTDAATINDGTFMVMVFDAIPTGPGDYPIGVGYGIVASGTCVVTVQGFDSNSPYMVDGTTKTFDAGTYYILPQASNSDGSVDYMLSSAFSTVNLDGNYSESVSFNDMVVQPSS